MFKKKFLMSLLCLVVVLSFSATATRGANILFVSSMTAEGDDTLKAFMEALGHTVMYIDDDEDEAATETAAAAADMVFISESVSSGKIKNEITELAVPMVVGEPYAWDEMGLTEGGGGDDAAVTTDVEIVDPGHYLAAGLSGTVPVLTDILAGCNLGKGITGPEATVIATATLADGVTYDVIFVYEKGAALAVAPADGSAQVAADIRIGFGFHADCTPVLSDNYYVLLGAAVDYALGLTAPPEPEPAPPEPEPAPPEPEPAPPEPEPAPPEPAPAPPVPAGPVVIERTIVDESDDAEERADNSMYLDSSDLEFIYDNDVTLPADLQVVGIRFADIAIPKGSTITSASVQLQADDVDDAEHVGDAYVIIEGELNPNPGTFLGDAANISLRPRTTALVPWGPAHWTVKGDKYSTSDITSVIQEIVDQDGWASGNALVLIFSQDPANPSTGVVEAEAGPGDDAALLSIEYVVGEAPAPPEPEPAPPEPEPTPPAPGLVAHWQLDEGAGTIAADSSGNGLDGTLVGDPLWVAGMIGGALEFDGVDDNVDCGNPPILDFGTGDWTLSAWMNATAAPADDTTIVGKGGDHGGGIRYQMMLDSSDYIHLVVDDNTDKYDPGGDITVIDGQWHHIVMMRKDGTTLRLYVDGVEDMGVTNHGESTIPDTYDLSGTSQANAYIGAIWHFEESRLEKLFAGMIDDVRIYDYALTEAEVAAIASPVEPPAPAPPEPEPTPPEPEPAPPEPEPAPPEPEPAPPTPGVVERRIAAGSDDAEERDQDNGFEVELDSSDLELAWEDWFQGDMQVIGLRFTDITIPKGTKIKDAWVQFEVDETKGGTSPVFLTIYGELSADAATFSTTARDITGRPNTTELVWWHVENWTVKGEQGPDQKTPDISDIIQEIVDQSDWVSGNSLVLIFDHSRLISTGIRCAESFDGKAEAAPLLHIDVAQ